MTIIQQSTFEAGDKVICAQPDKPECVCEVKGACFSEDVYEVIYGDGHSRFAHASWLSPLRHVRTYDVINGREGLLMEVQGDTGLVLWDDQSDAEPVAMMILGFEGVHEAA